MSKSLLEENEFALEKWIAKYLKSTRIEKWQTVKLVEGICNEFDICSPDTALEIIKTVYTKELVRYREENEPKLSTSQAKRVEVFSRTAATLLNTIPIEKIVRKNLRENAMDAADLAKMTHYTRDETSSSINNYGNSYSNNNNNNGNVDLENDDNTSNSSGNGSSSRGTRSNNSTEGDGNNTNQNTSISSSNRATRSMKRSAELLSNLNKKVKILDDSLPSRIEFLKKECKIQRNIDLSLLYEGSEKDSLVHKIAKSLMRELGTELKSALTLKEHEILLKLCDANNKKDFEDIRRELFLLEPSLETPFIEYIRTAIHHMIILSSSDLLLQDNHGEDWYRTNVYSFSFDNIFLLDRGFKSMRAEIKPSIVHSLRLNHDYITDKMRIDFIYRKMDGKIDVFASEDKPASASKAKFRISLLKSLESRVALKSLVEEVEVVTSQMHGLKITIRGTKKIGKDYIHYTKAEAQLPATIEDNGASLAFYLYTIISLKRCIMVNCIKVHIIQEAKKTSNVQFLESGYLSDSPNKNDTDEKEENKIMEKQIEALIELRNASTLAKTKRTLEQVVFREDLLQERDFEYLVMRALMQK
ncbi:hypothetical protein BDA99DRAFT_564253 [Phascolomyces articulosus]|uniref:Uncharacterized protein n=1 Tax=Phascolomyces articulosus TaxID=60185 RepID=A0AAD5K0S5_9FUNG|nr:hypothetical protein BDA99DRAFT_564253 [Phascolomyces articulosus]